MKLANSYIVFVQRKHLNPTNNDVYILLIVLIICMRPIGEGFIGGNLSLFTRWSVCWLL